MVSIRQIQLLLCRLTLMVPDLLGFFSTNKMNVINVCTVGRYKQTYMIRILILDFTYLKLNGMTPFCSLFLKHPRMQLILQIAGIM